MDIFLEGLNILSVLSVFALMVFNVFQKLFTTLLSVQFCSPCFTFSLHSALCTLLSSLFFYLLSCLSCQPLDVQHRLLAVLSQLFFVTVQLYSLFCLLSNIVFVTVQLYSLSCLAIKPLLLTIQPLLSLYSLFCSLSNLNCHCLKNLTNFLANFLSLSINSSDNGDYR
jgi:hypothetical protein